MPNSEQEWIRISEQFAQQWNFDNCCGALDGKHIVITPPTKTGSEYFNYKKNFSIVLLALVDADYKFLYVDVGTNGCISDGGVFANSTLSRDLQENTLHMPSERPLPDRNKPMPFVIVADDAFPLRDNIMKPFTGRNLISYERRVFNYRLSRARRVVENAFGILANRFRIFLSTILLPPEKAQLIVLAACALHNFLRMHSPNEAPDDLINSENTTNDNVSEGSLQQNDHYGTWLPLAQNVNGRRNANVATEVREEFCAYFSNEGKVSFQDIMVQDY